MFTLASTRSRLVAVAALAVLSLTSLTLEGIGSLAVAHPDPNHLALTPPMGWSNWDAFSPRTVTGRSTISHPATNPPLTVASPRQTKRPTDGPLHCRPLLMIAHRGHVEPGITENTIASFESARKLGARAVEFDVHVNSQGRFIVMHDSTADRTTDGHGWVSAMTTSQIRRLRTDGGQRIPFLADALAWGKAHHTQMLLEIKYDTSRAWSRRDLTRLVAAVTGHGLTGQVTFFSLRAYYVRLIERVAPRQHTAWIVDGTPNVRLAADVDMVMMNAELVTPAVVKSLRQAGVLVTGRRNNDPRQVRRIAEAGVVAVVTDQLLPHGRRAGKQRPRRCEVDESWNGSSHSVAGEPTGSEQ